MKTDFRKWLPVIVMAVAVGGAFTTHAMNEKAETNTLVQGYIQVNGDEANCQEPETCTTLEGETCTVEINGSQEQLYGKDVAGNCNIQLFRPGQ